MSEPAGRLVLVATPIGNLGDISDRAKQVLSDAEFWFVEDSRQSGKLQQALGLKKPMKVLNDHATERKIAEFAELVESGVLAALVSDAGTPIVSDPGAELVSACIGKGIEIDAIPGPSAVSVALCLAGFYAQRYAFLGFLSRKASHARETLLPFASSSLTIVLFESPHRIESTLRTCFEVLGERNFAICRELTKMHQQVFRARLPEIPGENQVPRKGEVTIVIEGHRRGPQN